MALLGFDAIGRWALGQLPQTSSGLSIVAVAGSFALNGQAATFAISEVDRAGSFAFTGTASPLNVSEAATAGAFALNGFAAAFKISDAVVAGSYALTSVGTVDMIGERATPTGALVTMGVAATFVFTTLESPGVFPLDGVAATLARDFVNWVKRPFSTDTWNAESEPPPGWSGVVPPSPHWNSEAGSLPSWTVITPPSNAWAVDPVQQILPPASE